MPMLALLVSRSPSRRVVPARISRLALAAALAWLLPVTPVLAEGNGGNHGGGENGDNGGNGPKARVLRVGTWNGIKGPYTDIQSAVDAARPGDWILVGPGDYHERGDYANPGDEAGGGVFITKPGLHLRGMDRNQVVIDGTRPGSLCSSSPADQDPGPTNSQGQPLGRNGVLVFKADGVSVENLTACNGAGGGGNEIWWNGGDGSGQVGLGPYRGQYLSATST